jgi:hypothetical protein
VAVSVTNATGDGGVVGSLGLFDTVTHDFSVLSWPDDRGNLAQPQQISFSPNGTRIAFVNAHDTDGTEGFKGYVVDVDAASLGDAALLHGELWDVTYAVFGAGHEVLVGLVGDTLETAQPQLVLPDSDPAASSVSALSLHAELPGVTDIFSSNGIFSLYAKAGDKVLRYDEISPTWEPTGFEAWTG